MSQVTTQPEPLRLPPKYNPQPGLVESLGRWVPILGWLVASTLEAQRMWPANKSIQYQLEAREPVPPEVWGEESDVQVFAKWFNRKIEEAFGFPSNRLMPDDPFEIVFFDDDLNINEILNDAIDEWGFTNAWLDEVYQTIERRQLFAKTLGEFLGYLISTREFKRVAISKRMSD